MSRRDPGRAGKGPDRADIRSRESVRDRSRAYATAARIPTECRSEAQTAPADSPARKPEASHSSNRPHLNEPLHLGELGVGSWMLELSPSPGAVPFHRLQSRS